MYNNYNVDVVTSTSENDFTGTESRWGLCNCLSGRDGVHI